MASFTIGAGGDRADIETAASDPISNPVGTPTEWYYLEDQVPVANVATINSNVAIYSNGYKTDTSKIASGICLQGGTWERADIRRYNNTAAVLIQNATTTRCTIYAPLQDGAVVGCTGDLNAVTTLNGDSTGLTGVDNKFVVNVSGVPVAYDLNQWSNRFDGVTGEVNSTTKVSLATAYNITVKGLFLDCNTLTRWIGERGTANNFVSYNESLGNIRVRTDDSVVHEFPYPCLESRFIDLDIVYDGVGIEVFVDGVSIGTSTTGFGRFDFDNIGTPYSPGAPVFYETLFSSISIVSGGSEVLKWSPEWGDTSYADLSGNGNTGTVSGGVAPVLSGPLTPKIGGSLLITSGTNAGLYAGGVQPSKGTNKYNFSYTYGW